MALSTKGQFWAIEIKSCLDDYRVDHKWHEYLGLILQFAVDPDFPLPQLPEDVGVILADFEAFELRPPKMADPLSAARRRSLLMKYATNAADRWCGSAQSFDISALGRWVGEPGHRGALGRESRRRCARRAGRALHASRVGGLTLSGPGVEPGRVLVESAAACGGACAGDGRSRRRCDRTAHRCAGCVPTGCDRRSSGTLAGVAAGHHRTAARLRRYRRLRAWAGSRARQRGDGRSNVAVAGQHTTRLFERASVRAVTTSRPLPSSSRRSTTAAGD